MSAKLIKKSYALSMYGKYCIDLYYFMNAIHNGNTDKAHKLLWEAHIDSNLAKYESLTQQPTTYLDDIMMPLIKYSSITKKDKQEYLNKETIIKLDAGLKHSVDGWLTINELSEVTGLTPTQIRGDCRRYKSITYYNKQDVLQKIADNQDKKEKKQNISSNRHLYIVGNKELSKYLKSFIDIGIIDSIYIEHGYHQQSPAQMFRDCVVNQNELKQMTARLVIYDREKVNNKVRDRVQTIIQDEQIRQNINALVSADNSIKD